MIEWIAGNIAAILICAALSAIVVLVIVCMIRSRKKGKSSCGGNCAGCAWSGTCHSGR